MATAAKKLEDEVVQETPPDAELEENSTKQEAQNQNFPPACLSSIVAMKEKSTQAKNNADVVPKASHSMLMGDTQPFVAFDESFDVSEETAASQNHPTRTMNADDNSMEPAEKRARNDEKMEFDDEEQEINFAYEIFLSSTCDKPLEKRDTKFALPKLRLLLEICRRYNLSDDDMLTILEQRKFKNLREIEIYVVKNLQFKNLFPA